MIVYFLTKGAKMTILYHGTSSRFAEEIIKNGLGVVYDDGEFSEVRSIFSKYINPKILTDDFFRKYSRFMVFGSVSSLGLRKMQALDGSGPFAVFFEDLDEAKYWDAPVYAKRTTEYGAGEFEFGVVRFLNSIEESLENSTDSEKTEFLTLLKNNAKPEYVKPDGSLRFYTGGDYETDTPILLKINVPDDVVGRRMSDDARIKTVVKPENIEGVAFLPPFYFGDGADRFVPDLEFLPKEQFLQELKNHEKNQQQGCEFYEIKDVWSEDTKFIFSFPTDKIACVQEFISGRMHYSYFYARQGRVNQGLRARKRYEKGLPYSCAFFDKYKQEVAQVLFADGKPHSICFYENNKIVEKFIVNEAAHYFYENGVLVEVFCSSKDKQGVHRFFENGKIVKENVIEKGNPNHEKPLRRPKRLTKEQLFILQYEKQPQKVITKEARNSIANKLRQGICELQSRLLAKDNANTVER